MTHTIKIAVDTGCNKYEWADRIADALIANERVDADKYGEFIIIETSNIMQTIDALKNDGFDI